MYFPKSQITTDLTCTEGQFSLVENGDSYVGKYFRTSKGTIYTGANPDDGPNRPLQESNLNTGENNLDVESQSIASYSRQANVNLLPPTYENIAKSKQPTNAPIITSTPLPTPENYSNNIFYRYYLKNTNSYRYNEIDQNQYQLFRDQDPSVQYQLFIPLRINWVITGNLLDAYKKNIEITEKTSEKNKWAGFVESFKGRFARYFKNDTNKFFYTTGGELKVDKTNEEYIGYYHASPFTGNIMEGKVHIDTPHNILTLIKEGEVLTKKFISMEGEVGTSRRRNIPRGLY